MTQGASGGAKPEEVDLGSLYLGEPSIEEGPAKRVERTRATLAYCLFGLLAGILAVLFGLLAAQTLTAQQFADVAGVVLAPVVGLFGAATGYYYGRSGQ